MCTHIRARDAAEQGWSGEKGVDHVYDAARERDASGAGGRGRERDELTARGYSEEVRRDIRGRRGFRRGGRRD